MYRNVVITTIYNQLVLKSRTRNHYPTQKPSSTDYRNHVLAIITRQKWWCTVNSTKLIKNGNNRSIDFQNAHTITSEVKVTQNQHMEIPRFDINTIVYFIITIVCLLDSLLILCSCLLCHLLKVIKSTWYKPVIGISIITCRRIRRSVYNWNIIYTNLISISINCYNLYEEVYKFIWIIYHY